MKKFLSIVLALTLALTMAACGGETETAVSVDVNALYESYADYMPDMFQPDPDTLMNMLGINVEDCKQYVVSICAEGMRTDEVWLIEAKDQAALETLQKLAQTRIEAKLDETVSYAPDQYVFVEKAQVLTNGMYLALLISPDVEELKAGFEAAFQ